MKEDKTNYLKLIRAETAYPTYRGMVNLLTILGYVMAGLLALFYFIGGIVVMINTSFFAGLFGWIIGAVATVIQVVIVRFMREISFMIADMVDSTIDTNSKK